MYLCISIEEFFNPNDSSFNLFKKNMML